MARTVHLFDRPARFVAGTVGLPGERTFFLQARQGARLISVALEKEQVRELAARLGDLLDHVASETGVDTHGVGPADLDPLDSPIDEEFRVGVLALGWNGNNQHVVIEAHAQTPGVDDVPDLEDDSDEGPDVLRVRIEAAAARAFSRRALSVVAAGRPPCPLCDLPLDARGHICPRANGYRRRG
jgi:uncharacterized repeat protein (TIGR03847 family)